jgi:hypothetical protein
MPASAAAVQGTLYHRADPPGEHDYLPFTTAGLRAVSRVTLAAIERLEALRPGGNADSR